VSLHSRRIAFDQPVRSLENSGGAEMVRAHASGVVGCRQRFESPVRNAVALIVNSCLYKIGTVHRGEHAAFSSPLLTLQAERSCAIFVVGRHWQSLHDRQRLGGGRRQGAHR
jgi:hypothetical protein